MTEHELALEFAVRLRELRAAFEEPLAPGRVEIGKVIPGPLSALGLVTESNVPFGRSLYRRYLVGDLLTLLRALRGQPAAFRREAALWFGVLGEMDRLEARVARLARELATQADLEELRRAVARLNESFRDLECEVGWLAAKLAA